MYPCTTVHELVDEIKSKYVDTDIKNCEYEKKILRKLDEAEGAVKDETVWMSIDELKKSVGK